MRRRLLATVGLTALALLLQYCAGDETPPPDNSPLKPSIDRPAPPPPVGRSKEVAPTADSENGERGLDPAEQRANLDKITGVIGPLATSVGDVRAILAAHVAEKAGDQGEAVKKWREALEQANGRIGQRALEGWIKAYVRQLGKRSDVEVLARLIMSETQQGALSPYMLARGLTNDGAVVPILRQVVPEYLTKAVGPKVTPGETSPPEGKGALATDPLLVKTVGGSCAAFVASHATLGNAAIGAWQKWVEGLAAPQRQYWVALQTQTCGDAGAAITAYKNVLPSLAGAPETQAMAVEAAGRLAALQRSLGQRLDAAETYLALYTYWSNPGVTSRAMGIEDGDFALRRIDETLWASRYRALVGDYETAKIAAQHALTLIGNAQTLKSSLSKKRREQLASLRAEAYHALAFRVAVEKHEFDSARSLSLLGLATPELNKEWKDRLRWYAGLYDYQSGQFESARQRWASLLDSARDDTMRAGLLFWLARAYSKLDQPAAAKAAVDNLLTAYPLSFYATIAVKQADLASADAWQAQFGDLVQLEARLMAHRDWNLKDLRSAPSLARLLQRAEILVAASLGEYARLAVEDLEAGMTANVNVGAQPEAWIYLSRLAYGAGAYLKAINLTAKVVKVVPGFWQQWPEQILVYFPRPYMAAFQRNALDNGIDVEHLLAIARQESGFTPDIQSSANAIGLMQLIQPTAKIYAAELQLPTDQLPQLLSEPEANIRIGSRYLKSLWRTYKGYSPAVYGGYNAGEAALDLWLKRRAQSDPLMFVELVPFAETKDYIKGVWRNAAVYRQLAQVPTPLPRPSLDLIPISTKEGKALAPPR